MKINFINTQSGFSLVQGMILAGVIAGSSLVATRMITDQKMAQKGAETRDLVEELNNVVYSVLQNRNNCRQTMVDNNLQLTLGTSTAAQTLARITTVNGTATGTPIAVRGSSYMNNSVKVESMRLTAQTGGWRTLEITYERLDSADLSAKTKKGYGAKHLKKRIALRIQKEPLDATVFSTCYAVTADKNAMNGLESGEQGNDIAKQLCEDMNDNRINGVSYTSTGPKAFVWDEALSICKPNAQCPNNQIFTGIDSLGTVKCRNLEDWIDLSEVMDATPPSGCAVGKQVRLQVDNASKKVRIECF